MEGLTIRETKDSVTLTPAQVEVAVSRWKQKVDSRQLTIGQLAEACLLLDAKYGRRAVDQLVAAWTVAGAYRDNSLSFALADLRWKASLAR
jgi:hypothetical protein